MTVCNTTNKPPNKYNKVIQGSIIYIDTDN